MNVEHKSSDNLTQSYPLFHSYFALLKKGLRMNANTHTAYMSFALHLAEQGRFTVSPNPMVGCVIVKNNKIVGTGYHERRGEAHAEIVALKAARMEAKDATAYVTLEPCCHYGKTPPCTNALIAAGIKKVFVACIDPNVLVAGKGIAALRQAGIEVEVGLHSDLAKELNAIFFHYIQNKRPYVIAKWAMSLNGKTRVHQNEDKQISCAHAKIHTHQLRQQVDAILVGAQTAIQDNPQLTIRLEDKKIFKQPTRIILTGRTSLPSHLKIITGELPGKTIVVVTKANSKNRINTANVEYLVLPETANGFISLPKLLDELGKREIASILVEGGMTVHENFFRENLVNRIHVYLAPTFIGSATRQQINILDFAHQGQDLHFTATLRGD